MGGGPGNPRAGDTCVSRRPRGRESPCKEEDLKDLMISCFPSLGGVSRETLVICCLLYVVPSCVLVNTDAVKAFGYFHGIPTVATEVRMMRNFC